MIKKIADYIINYNSDEWNMNMKLFDWSPGVALYGMYKVYEKTGDKKYLNFLTGWAEQHLKDVYSKKTVNSTAPLLTILELYKINKNEEYLNVCKDIAEWIINEAPITRDGGLEHTVIEDVEGFSEQIWADTLFMSCIFLAKLGVFISDNRYTDFAVKQLKIHHKLLFSEKASLYYHGWNCEKKNHMSGVYWGRANAWIIYSTMEIINTTGEFSGYSEICSYIKKHALALKNLQREDGSFGTILNDETSYSETSAVGGISAGLRMAEEKGLLDSSYSSVWKKGIAYVKRSVCDNGRVSGVSHGTPVMKNAEEYKNIPIIPTLYGQGLAILSLI